LGLRNCRMQEINARVPMGKSIREESWSESDSIM
jgi:hypothetical protein